VPYGKNINHDVRQIIFNCFQHGMSPENDFENCFNSDVSIISLNSPNLSIFSLREAQTKWAYLFRNADDSSFLRITDMTRTAFEKLLLVLFDDDNAARLGLYLLWIVSSMKLKGLCLQFRVIESTARENISAAAIP